VIDRTQLILDIFAKHQTREAQFRSISATGIHLPRLGRARIEIRNWAGGIGPGALGNPTEPTAGESPGASDM